jgi:hypothetical protein
VKNHAKIVLKWVLPASNDAALGPADGNVISDDEEPDPVRFGRMLCGELFFSKTEVEHISRIISSRWSV